MNTYHIIIGAACVIILSFLFNLIAKRTNVPSVLMLIVLGIGLQFYQKPDISTGGSEEWLMSILEILGNVGLIFIVLEAALDLKLRRDKVTMILKSFFVALLVLVLSSLSISAFFYFLWRGYDNVSIYTCMMYSVPLSIMSSAIIIPSVGGLKSEKKEFMIYESTFSDILGIMLFYFLKDNRSHDGLWDLTANISINIGATVLIALAASYLLVLLFQKIEASAKYFLMFAILLLLYALGKTFHLSSLLIILFFGLVLNNTNLFFRGPLALKSVPTKMKESMHELHVITLETAFVLRTFFFVIFGVTISLASLISLNVFVISVVVVILLFVMRYIFLKIFLQRDIVPELWIAPRGLITILLFYAIPNGHIDNHGHVLENYDLNFDATIRVFDSGILLYTILITSIIMTVALILNRGDRLKDVILDTFSKDDSNEVTMVDRIEHSLIDEEDEIYTEKENNKDENEDEKD